MREHETHASVMITGGHATIGTLAIGDHAVARSVSTVSGAPIVADDGTQLDRELLLRALRALTEAVDALAQPDARQHELLAELTQVLGQHRPLRHRALEILAAFADGSAAGQTLSVALGAALGALGAR